MLPRCHFICEVYPVRSETHRHQWCRLTYTTSAPSTSGVGCRSGFTLLALLLRCGAAVALYSFRLAAAASAVHILRWLCSTGAAFLVRGIAEWRPDSRLRAPCGWELRPRVLRASTAAQIRCPESSEAPRRTGGYSTTQEPRTAATSWTLLRMPTSPCRCRDRFGR